MNNETDALLDRIAELEARNRELALQAMSSNSQAHDAYERQKELKAKLTKALETMTEVRNDCIARADKNNVVPIGRGAWDHLTATLEELKGTAL